MTRYLLDTNELIHFARGREPFASRVQELLDSDDEVGVSPVCVAEFYSNLSPDRREQWAAFLREMEFWPVTFEDAVAAGMFRYEFARRGNPLSTPDTLIAASARRLEAVIVTENVKDFPMDGVRLLSLAGD